MPTYRFIINGLRHHDFADRLDELFLSALGRRVTLSIEPDNPSEADAVIAYLGQCCLGYVRSAQRAEACGLIRALGLEAMQGRMVEADPQRRWLTVEVVADEALPSLPIGRPAHPLTGWHFDGRTLPEEEKEHRLRTLLASLLLTVKACEPWEEDMEEWLVYVDQELWRDISSDCSEKVEQLLRLLTDGTPAQPLYADKALRLQLAMDRMGSPEVRRQQAEHICQRAFSRSMDELLCYYKGDEPLQAVLTLPAELLRLYLTDSEALMGRLWYYRLPREQVRGVLTLLALMVRLRKDEPALSPSDIEPFRFIHPALDDEAILQVHREMTHLCRHFGIQDICAYLNHLASTGRVLQPQSAQSIYDELTRLGMPASSPGFDYKTFMKYYRR